MKRTFLVQLAGTVVTWIIAAVLVWLLLPVVHREWHFIPALSIEGSFAVIVIAWLISAACRPAVAKP